MISSVSVNIFFNFSQELVHANKREQFGVFILNFSPTHFCVFIFLNIINENRISRYVDMGLNVCPTFISCMYVLNFNVKVRAKSKFRTLLKLITWFLCVCDQRVLGPVDKEVGGVWVVQKFQENAVPSFWISYVWIDVHLH